MANLNRVSLIGRLTMDPEVRQFSNGGKVAKFGFAVNNRKKNQQKGQWEDEPVWLNCEAFNRGENGTLADRIEKSCRKGSQLYLEGHLQLDQWTTQQGEKRQQLKIVVDQLQTLDPRQDGENNRHSEQMDSGHGSRHPGSTRFPKDGPPAYSAPNREFLPEGDLPF
jgi:single-strand DNA-binding protein